MPTDYVFPFQNEAIPVLRAAMRANSRDAHAPYYLGNVLFDWQPDDINGYLTLSFMPLSRASMTA